MRLAPKLLACCVALVSDVATLSAPAAWVSRARAAEEWQGRFEEVCSKTQDAMTLSSEELRSLITRCDELKPSIAALDESRRKVYGKRLQLCRDLYEFVLQSRDKG